MRKIGPRDLAAGVISGVDGATTVAGTLAVCQIAGIHFMATGGIGGVHRGWQRTATSRPTWPSSPGPRSASSAPARSPSWTCRRRWSGWRPLASRSSATGPTASRSSTPGTARTRCTTGWTTRPPCPPGRRPLGVCPHDGARGRPAGGRRGGARPRPHVPIIDAAVAEAEASGVTGAAFTPFVLGACTRTTGGTPAANSRLITDKARPRADRRRVLRGVGRRRAAAEPPALEGAHLVDQLDASGRWVIRSTVAAARRASPTKAAAASRSRWAVGSSSTTRRRRRAAPGPTTPAAAGRPRLRTVLADERVPAVGQRAHPRPQLRTAKRRLHRPLVGIGPGQAGSRGCSSRTGAHPARRA